MTARRRDMDKDMSLSCPYVFTIREQVIIAEIASVQLRASHTFSDHAEWLTWAH